MAANPRAYKKWPFVFTPPLILKYCWLDKPDEYQGEEQYKTRGIIIDEDAAEKFVEHVIKLGKEHAAKAGVRLKKNFKTPFQMPEDADPEDFEIDPEKGRARLDEDYRDRVWFATKSAFKPALIGLERDEKGAFKELPEGTRIMSGDEARLKLQVYAYEGLGSGITLRLYGCQLLKKKSGFSGGAGEGWGDVPEGYEEERRDNDDSDDYDDDIPF